MNQKGNRILAFSLACLMLVGNLFHYPFYVFALQNVKNQMRQELLNPLAAAENSTSFYFSAEDFKNAKMNDDEICLQGKWYDIESVGTTKNGSVQVKCLADNDESILHSWLKKSLDDNSENSNAPSGKSGKHSQISSLNDFIPVDTKHKIAAVSVSAILVYPSAVTGVFAGHSSLPELPPRA